MVPTYGLAALAAQLFILAIHPASALPAPGHNSIAPIVSAAWLNNHLRHESPNLIVIDIRDTQSYTSGHIPSSLSLPFQGTPLWSSNGSGSNQTLVMPSTDTIVTTLTALGLTTSHRVVIVPDAAILPSQMAMATRAAATLRYAGMPIQNVAILDGGNLAWMTSNYTVSTTPGKPTTAASEFNGKINPSFVVDRNYVKSRIGKVSEGVILIDARAASDYSAGHIESASSLPAAGIWKKGGFWKEAEELQKMFEAAIGKGGRTVGRRKGEVVVYCRTGMLASTWVYVLTSVLRFENVKLYDGSWEDWVANGEKVAV